MSIKMASGDRQCQEWTSATILKKLLQLPFSTFVPFRPRPPVNDDRHRVQEAGQRERTADNPLTRMIFKFGTWSLLVLNQHLPDLEC